VCQPDEQIMARADRENRILISADTDFGELLANAPVLAPSVILLRRTDKTARSLVVSILANLEQVADDPRGPGRVLRSRSPDMVRQEIYGYQPTIKNLG
jgi:predicted nuclease of predicted toxin-antitoxin system